MRSLISVVLLFCGSAFALPDHPAPKNLMYLVYDSYAVKNVSPRSTLYISVVDTGEVKAKLTESGKVKLDLVIDTLSASLRAAISALIEEMNLEQSDYVYSACSSDSSAYYQLEAIYQGRYLNTFRSASVADGKSCNWVGKRPGGAAEVLAKLLWMYKSYVDSCVKSSCAALPSIP